MAPRRASRSATVLRKIRDAALGDPAAVKAFHAADDALQAHYQAALRGEVPLGETAEYLQLNGRVNDLWNTVPWWRR